MDSEGLVRQWTSHGETLFGHSAAFALGKSLGDLIVPEAMRPYHEMGFRRYVATREPNCVGYTVEVEALHKSGQTLPIEMKIVANESDGELLFEAHISSAGGAASGTDPR